MPNSITCILVFPRRYSERMSFPFFYSKRLSLPFFSFGTKVKFTIKAQNMYFEGLHTFIVTKFDCYLVPNLEVTLIHYFGIQKLSFIYVYHLCMGKIFKSKNKSCLICREHCPMIKTCSFLHPNCEFEPFVGRN